MNIRGTVTDGPVNVRSGAGTGYKVIGKLSKGKTITVVTKKTNSKGDTWYKYEYDVKGNDTYYENSSGYWERKVYDVRDNLIYFENSDGFWKKHTYDLNGNLTRTEDSDGNWVNYIVMEI